MTAVRRVGIFDRPQSPTGGTVYLAPSVASGLDEDEVLLEWLRANLDTLSTAEKRTAVRRLYNEFGYTNRGLSVALGLSEGSVRHLRATDEELERERVSNRTRSRGISRVYAPKLNRFANQWQERASQGLTPQEALRLLDELRALAPDRSAG
jgi:hypothetical protein